MGLKMSKDSHFLIYIRTGDRKYTGTDANVSIILHDDAGNCSDTIKLDNFLHDDFERGRQDKFEVSESRVKNLHGQISKVEFWRDNSGLCSGWYVDKIMVENRRTNGMFVFPVFRWIRPFDHYFIKHLDTSLPQDDEYREQREKDLEGKRKTYRFSQKRPGMPAQVRDLPPDEQFSFEYKWDIVKTKLQLIATSKLKQILSGTWKTLADLINVYTDKVFHKPRGVDRWRNDFYFGLQRICGPNSIMIELCTAIPDKLPVDDAMLQPPRTKDPRSEEDILKTLPDRSITLDIMTVTKILSQKGTKSLGDFEVQYIFDPRAMAVVDEFRRDLTRIGKEINERNSRRKIPYYELDPVNVPNSISI